jgi:hypothetical protein
MSPLLASGFPADAIAPLFMRIGIAVVAVFSSGLFVFIVGRVLVAASVPPRQADESRTRMDRLWDNLLIAIWGVGGVLTWYLLASTILQKAWPR